MAYPTRAHCTACNDTDALFVWDSTAREWRCNGCKTLKQRETTHTSEWMTHYSRPKSPGRPKASAKAVAATIVADDDIEPDDL